MMKTELWKVLLDIMELFSKASWLKHIQCQFKEKIVDKYKCIFLILFFKYIVISLSYLKGSSSEEEKDKHVQHTKSVILIIENMN